MKTLSIDIETYSSINLSKCGVYKYTEAPDFEILLFGYSVDGNDIKVIDLAQGEHLPQELIDALTDDSVIKWAFNANFERVCLSRYLHDLGISLDPFHDSHPLSQECSRFLNPESWRCSMVWAATMGLPLSLEGVGSVLGLEKQKLTEGKELIKYFSVPCAPTKANGGRIRNRPFHDPEKWDAFKRYNIRDVETEMGIKNRPSKFPVPEAVWDEYHIDQEINDRGVRLDMDLVKEAIEMDTRSRKELTAAMKEITDLDNPNSVQQMKQWLSDNGLETDSLGKKVVAELIKTAPPELQNVLELRQQLAKSSVKKYQTMERAVCDDGRARGMFMFYGANRTGRWAGRLIQLQNLPQNHLQDLAEARALVKSGDFDAVKLLYEDVPDTLSQLIRTAFIPKDGTQFYVSDFSAIEARVIGWYAGEMWRQKVFEKGGDTFKRRIHSCTGYKYTAWCCNTHIEDKNKCHMLFVKDEALKQAFTTMVNKLIFSHRQILKLYLEALKNTSTDDSLHRIQQVQTLLAQNTEKRETLTRLLTQGIIDPILFNKETNDLLSQADSFRDEIEALKNEVSGDVTKVTETTALIHFCQKSAMLQEFDEDLFERFVKRIIVHSRDDIRFELKCGLILRERTRGHRTYTLWIQNRKRLRGH